MQRAKHLNSNINIDIDVNINVDIDSIIDNKWILTSNGSIRTYITLCSIQHRYLKAFSVIKRWNSSEINQCPVLRSLTRSKEERPDSGGRGRAQYTHFSHGYKKTAMPLNSQSKKMGLSGTFSRKRADSSWRRGRCSPWNWRKKRGRSHRKIGRASCRERV